MPVFELGEHMVFPPPGLAEPDGLLALGGDLSVERLTLAYSMGIFPWYTGGSPILWWSTDPRLVLIPSELRVSRSLRQTLRRNLFEITFDQDFEGVISACAAVERKGQEGTWITPEMREAYIALHRAGRAHSVESWREDALVGGLYGVSIGKAFFGESMFALASDASKAAFVSLVGRLRERGYAIIDCQQTTAHLMSFGARQMPRSDFLGLLRDAVNAPDAWGQDKEAD
jgi:leucyl/phenylalanyl-tRNA--protein transferase